MEWLQRIAPYPRHFWQGRWAEGTVEPPRVLYDHELVFVTHGSCIIHIGETDYPCPAGHFVIVPPGTVHSTLSTSHVFRHCVHFDWVYRGEINRKPIWSFSEARFAKAEMHRAPPWVPKGIIHGTFGQVQQITRLVDELSRRWFSGKQSDRMLARATVLELLLVMLKPGSIREAVPDRESQLALQVKQLLDQPRSPTDTMRTHLETLGFSYEHLCRVFRKHFGTTPVRYQNEARIEHAKMLLRHRRLNTAEVAMMLGFNDASYFCRLFKRIAGMKPRDVSSCVLSDR